MGLSVLDNVLVPARKTIPDDVRERGIIKSHIQDVIHAKYYLGFVRNYTDNEDIKRRLEEADAALTELYRELVDRISKLDGGEL